MSETKETQGEPTSEAEAESAAETESAPEGSDSESNDRPEPDDAGPADEAALPGAPTKKKAKAKAREESSTEVIRDRNQRVRAEAAEKRRSKREREQPTGPRARNLDAGEMMDDALARSTHAAAGFLRRHFNKVQWAIMVGLVGWVGWEVYSWRQEQASEKSTDALLKALAAETGKVGPADTEQDPRTGLTDTRRDFASDDQRLHTAAKEYELASTAKAPSAATLATLGAAGVYYDLGKYQQAKQAYEKVKSSAIAAKDTDVKGRALEGLGMALEALKDEDGALKAFRELQNLEVAGLSGQGLYHQARLLKTQGKNEDATKLLAKAGEKLVASKENLPAINYLRRSVLDLYETLDPKAARELAQKLAPADMMKQLTEGPGGGAPTMDQTKLKELLEKISKEAPQAPAATPDQPAEVPMPAPEGDPAPAAPGPP